MTHPIRSICVIGSSNTDMVVRGARIPAPGETVLGGEFFLFPGGKGANQAVAAARLGGNVSFIACIGNDSFGRESLGRFQAEGIDCRWIQTDPVAPSGVAMITVDAHGENSIIVAPGANACVTPELVTAAIHAMPADAIILIQLEIPIATVVTAIREANNRGLSVILNPAPAAYLQDELFNQISIITPNETEAEMLTGILVIDSASAVQAAQWFHDKGVEKVVITLGSGGAFYSDRERSGIIKAAEVTVADTTGAGDCFSGALAVAIAEGKDFPEAIHFACAAATCSVTRMGAQPSMPDRSQVIDMLNSSI
ncbi:MAG: ribokinase [Bacteroidota bacterium]